MFIAFINRSHKQYGDQSKHLYETLKQLSVKFPQLILAYLEGKDFTEKKREMGITWNEEPALAYSNHSDRDQWVFPRDKPFTKDNLGSFFSKWLIGRFAQPTKTAHNKPSQKGM